MSITKSIREVPVPSIPEIRAAMAAAQRRHPSSRTHDVAVAAYQQKVGLA